MAELEDDALSSCRNVCYQAHGKGELGCCDHKVDDDLGFEAKDVLSDASIVHNFDIFGHINEFQSCKALNQPTHQQHRRAKQRERLEALEISFQPKKQWKRNLRWSACQCEFIPDNEVWEANVSTASKS